MDVRMRRSIVPVLDEQCSKLSIFKSRDNSDTLFNTIHLNNISSKDSKIYDRNAMRAMFEREVAIPRYRKNSLLRQIKENTVERQVDTQEVKIKKLRKKLDIKKVAVLKKKISKSKLVPITKDPLFDEDLILYNARTRLTQNYEQIKRILQESDNKTSNIYRSQQHIRSYGDDRASTINLLAFRAGKVSVPEPTKPSGDSPYGGRRVIMEEAVMDGKQTNDLYDYTVAPLTQRNILDIARHKASWSERRSMASHTSAGSIMGGSIRISIPANAATRKNTMMSVAPADKYNFTMDHSYKRRSTVQSGKMSMSTSTQLNEYEGFVRHSAIPLGLKVQEASSFVKIRNVNARPSNDMKVISVNVGRSSNIRVKTNEKTDSSDALRKNMDSYIWYLIDPVAKRKYDLFLQKANTLPIRGDSF